MVRTLALAGVMLLGCSGTDDSTAPPGDDGRYHPAASGTKTDETGACETISQALRDRALELGCTNTMRPCPELLRTEYGTSCMQYDLGTVSACETYFLDRSTCAELDAQACVLVPYPGTEPAGCI